MLFFLTMNIFEQLFKFSSTMIVVLAFAYLSFREVRPYSHLFSNLTLYYNQMKKESTERFMGSWNMFQHFAKCKFIRKFERVLVKDVAERSYEALLKKDRHLEFIS